jgi:hypothetical protein
MGILTLLFFGLSFVISGFLPPLSPSLSPDQVAALFAAHGNSIRLGMILMLFSGCTMFLFTAYIAVQLHRIENLNLFWSYSQIIAGAGGAVVIVIGAMLMSTATFRPDRPAEITYALYDLAWIMLIMPGTPGAFQNFAIGFAVLSDKSKISIFPRWYGFLCLWTGVLYLPGVMLTFFKTGPFAWDGVFSFWMEASAFGVWFVATIVTLRR